MTTRPNHDRLGILRDVAYIINEYEFDDAGLCTTLGKFEREPLTDFVTGRSQTNTREGSNQ